MMTTIARNSGLTGGGTPRKVIVDLRVWIVKTPITVPAMLNLPPMSEVPPSTTARIASSSMYCPAAFASAAMMFELYRMPAMPASRPLAA